MINEALKSKSGASHEIPLLEVAKKPVKGYREYFSEDRVWRVENAIVRLQPSLSEGRNARKTFAIDRVWMGARENSWLSRKFRSLDFQ